MPYAAYVATTIHVVIKSFDIFDALSEIGRPERRRTSDFQITCPFHARGRELNPSARLYVGTDSIFCFTCHKSWNPIALVAEHRGESYGVAASYIDAKYGGFEQRPTAKQDSSLALTIQAMGRCGMLERLRMLKEFDPILVAASRGESMKEVERLTHAFGVRHFGRLVQ